MTARHRHRLVSGLLTASIVLTSAWVAAGDHPDGYGQPATPQAASPDSIRSIAERDRGRAERERATAAIIEALGRSKNEEAQAAVAYASAELKRAEARQALVEAEIREKLGQKQVEAETMRHKEVRATAQARVEAALAKLQLAIESAKVAATRVIQGGQLSDRAADAALAGADSRGRADISLCEENGTALQAFKAGGSAALDGKILQLFKQYGGACDKDAAYKQSYVSKTRTSILWNAGVNPERLEVPNSNRKPWQHSQGTVPLFTVKPQAYEAFQVALEGARKAKRAIDAEDAEKSFQDGLAELNEFYQVPAGLDYVRDRRERFQKFLDKMNYANKLLAPKGKEGPLSNYIRYDAAPILAAFEKLEAEPNVDRVLTSLDKSGPPASEVRYAYDLLSFPRLDSGLFDVESGLPMAGLVGFEVCPDRGVLKKRYQEAGMVRDSGLTACLAKKEPSSADSLPSWYTQYCGNIRAFIECAASQGALRAVGDIVEMRRLLEAASAFEALSKGQSSHISEDKTAEDPKLVDSPRSQGAAGVGRGP